MNPFKYDILILGAGAGACALAEKLARAGLSVALADKDSRADIGARSFDEIAPRAILENLNLEGDGVSAASFKKLTVHPGHGVAPVAFEAAAELLDGEKLNRVLLDRAAAKGAALFDRAKAVHLTTEEDRVAGAIVESGQEKKMISATITVDATGGDAPLAGEAPSPWDRALAWKGDPISICGGTVSIGESAAAFEEGLHVSTEMDGIVCRSGGRLSLSLRRRGGGKADRSDLERFGKEFAKIEHGIEGVFEKRARVGFAPKSLVAPGLALFGARAGMTRILDGESAALSLAAVDPLADAIEDAIKNNDEDSLWDWNRSYHQNEGSHAFALAVMREFFSRLSTEQIARLVEARILDEVFFRHAALENRMPPVGRLRVSWPMLQAIPQALNDMTDHQARLLGRTVMRMGAGWLAFRLYPGEPDNVMRWRLG